MAKVYRKNNENIEQLIERFNKQAHREGLYALYSKQVSNIRQRPKCIIIINKVKNAK